jgi:hypothetical protein
LQWQASHSWHSHHGEQYSGLVAGGYSVDRILTAYPDLSREDVSAALEYAAKVVDEEQVISR